MLKYKKKKGFTIIELIVVMAIIGVLVLLAVPKFMNHTQQARLTQIKSDTKQLENASERYYMDKNDWPRISDIPYTSAQITTFAQEVTDKTGQVVTLDSSGSYYDVDYTKLQQYIQKQKNDIHYIIQNPVGEIYHLGKLTTIGEERLNPPEIINNKPIAVITMTPGIAITTNTNITWSYGNSTDDDGDTIINAEWQGSQNIYTTAGTYTVNLRVKDSKGLWSDWVSSTFSVSSIPTKTIETIVNGVLPANISSITASSVATWDGLLYSHWLAFDGKYDVMNNGWMSTDQSNAWLQVTFKASQNISMVKMVNSYIVLENIDVKILGLNI